MPPFTVLRVDHVVFRVRHLDASLAFYDKVLGCRVVRRRPDLGLVHIRVGTSMVDLVAVDGRLGLAGGMPPGAQGHNVDHLCLRVDPFDEAAIVAHLARCGIQPRGPASVNFGAEGDGLSLYLDDPDGNPIELKGPAADAADQRGTRDDVAPVSRGLVCLVAGLLVGASAVAALLTAPGAQAQQAPPPSQPPSRPPVVVLTAPPAPPTQPVSQDCLDQARQILRDRHAFHDGSAKLGLRPASDDEVRRLQRDGLLAGRLGGGSTLTPASAYDLVLLPGAATVDAGQACPLHRAYVRFRQGGFNPQEPVFHGPLRAPGP